MEAQQRMKTRLDKYILGSVMKVGVIAMLLCTLILASVDLISNLEKYIQLALPFSSIALRTVYYLPEALMMAIGPSFLFSITYFLSMLQANNEMICLLNAGIPYRRIIRPCLVLAVFVAVFYFAFNEMVGIEALKQKDMLEAKFYLSNSNYDNRNVTLADRDNGFVLFARRYLDNSRELQNTVLISKDSESNLLWRMTSDRAWWDEEQNNWVFEGNVLHQVSGSMVSSSKTTRMVIESLDIPPDMFRNVSEDIKTMELGPAFDYLERIRKFDSSQYTQLATDFYQRLFSCLTPLVLMLIACSINYKFKKNVLLFSIICCLCIGVVYYVVQMLTLIMASQGMISPEAGMLVPFALIGLLSLALTSTFRT